MKLTSPEALRAWCKHRGLSYTDLGRAAGVSKAFIGQLAQGQRPGCRAETALRIERVLLPPVDQRGPGDLPLFVREPSDRVGEVSETVGGR